MSDEYGGNFVVILPEELDDLRRQVREYLNTAKRVQADYINYQDRVKREKEELSRYCVEDLIRDLVPALDAFDSSIATLRDATVAEGIRMVQKELLKTLAGHGVQPIESLGRLFDPRYHQACGVVETKDCPEGTVVEDLKRGYRLHDRVLRPAMVKIAQPPKQILDSSLGSQ